jgi:hypothetical protein
LQSSCGKPRQNAELRFASSFLVFPSAFLLVGFIGWLDADVKDHLRFRLTDFSFAAFFLAALATST